MSPALRLCFIGLMLVGAEAYQVKRDPAFLYNIGQASGPKGPSSCYGTLGAVLQ